MFSISCKREQVHCLAQTLWLLLRNSWWKNSITQASRPTRQTSNSFSYFKTQLHNINDLTIDTLIANIPSSLLPFPADVSIRIAAAAVSCHRQPFKRSRLKRSMNHFSLQSATGVAGNEVGWLFLVFRRKYIWVEEVGRPPARWTDDLIKIAGSRWMHVASDRTRWKSIGEPCVQQWTAMGWYDDDEEVELRGT